MTLKQVTHALHSELLHHTNDIKRSHCRELIAAYFGYKTMAALEKDGFFHNSPSDFGLYDLEAEYDLEVQSNYMYDAGFDDEPDSGMGSSMYIFLEHCSQLAPSIKSDFGLSCIEGALNKEHLYFITYDQLCDELEFMSVEPESKGHSYWYEMQLAGKELSNNQLKFANGYKFYLQSQKELKQIILGAASKGHKKAAYLSIRFLESEDLKIAALKKLVEKGNIQAALDLYEDYGLDEYLIYAAKLGDRQSLEELVNSFSEYPDFLEDNRFNAHYFNFLAQFHGHDLTKSSMVAIGDSDYGWNDSGSNGDYYGPLYADGNDGVHLPKLDEKSMLLARKKALNDFNNLALN